MNKKHNINKTFEILINCK